MIRASRASKVAGAFLVLFWHAKENLTSRNRALLPRHQRVQPFIKNQLHTAKKLPNGELFALSSSAGAIPPPQVQRAAAGHHREEAQHDEDAYQHSHEQKGRFGVGAKVGHILPVGDKIHRPHLITVKIDSGRAQHSALLDGGGSALRQGEVERHLVVGVAVAAEVIGGIQLHSLFGTALGQREGGQHRLRVHQGPVGEAGKGPVQKFRALPIDVVQVAAQHHEAIGMAILLGEGDEAPPREGGETGLHAPDIVAVVGVLRVQHEVGGLDGALVLVEVRCGQGIGEGVGGLHIGLVGVAGGGNFGEVFGCGDVAVVVQAVDAGEGGVLTAQLLGAGIHPGHKGRQVAARDIAGDDAGRVVGAGHQQAVQQVDAAHRLADAEVHSRAVGVLDVLELLRQGSGNGDLSIHILAALKEEQGRHHLGQAGDVPLLVGVLAKDGLAGVQIEEVYRLGIADRLDGHLVDGEAGQGGAGHQHQREQQRRGPGQEIRSIHRLCPP